MSKYAENTQVPIGRSRDEIERTLERFGATGQAWLRDDEKGTVMVGFRFQKATYRFMVPLPTQERVQHTPTGRLRTTSAAKDALAQETRRLFRSLSLYVKAILEASTSGLVTLEQALLPYQVLPGGSTVYEQFRPQLAEGRMPNLTHALMSGEREQKEEALK